jgi:uncharacterized protein (UPF0548 family)
MDAKKGEIFRRIARGMLLAWGMVMAALPSAAWGQTVPTIQWIRQFGTSSLDAALATAVDASGVYVAGETDGTLPGQTSAGARDAFVRKYDLNGNEVWTRQFGTSGFDAALGISVDASGVYVAGETDGTLPGQTIFGAGDAFVRKYDLDGNEVWTRQFGTSASADAAFGISVDASGVYVAGFTGGTLPGQTTAGLSDAFVRKYDVNGNEVWTRQFGTSTFDEALGISVDASGVYVAGFTYGTLPGQSSAGIVDAFVRKYDADGNEVWTRQFGTPNIDGARGISVDASGVYVAGFAYETLPGQTTAGVSDAFVRKYDADGNEVWTRQFGTLGYDQAWGVFVHASEVYVCGFVGGTLPGQTGGGVDAFARKYDINGNEMWTRQFGTSPSGDAAFGISADASGVYVAGFTDGTLPGQTNASYSDAFVIKIAEVEVTIVTVDIKPGVFPNSINLGSNGTVPVAILSTTTFDATTVDPTTVTLAGAQVAVRGKGTPMASIQDVNGDGLLDLVVHVSTEALQLSETDTLAVLDGQTFDGKHIRGTDTIRVVP